MVDTYVGRLAPSPTGLLHLGHAATFLRAAERAREHGGRLLLRNDDLDRERVRPQFVSAMLADLRWLGLTWAEPVITQSERLPLYREAMLTLVRTGAVYPCTCSRRELAAMLSAPHEDGAHPPDDEPVYPGRCRPRMPAAETHGELLAGVNYRFRVPDGQAIAFVDGAAGPRQFVAGCDARADFGDFLVWRRDGLPSYQLATVVDDAALLISEVVRGRDLLRSTARQISLQRALGLATPRYWHTPLLADASGVRLAKRHDALALQTLRERGLSPAEVRALAEERSRPSRPSLLA